MFLLFRQLLFKFQAEQAHHITMNMLSLLIKIPGFGLCLRLLSGISLSKKDTIQIAGIHFPNKIGLAAGFDKDANYLRVWKALGFGHVEVGTLTPLAQEGNPKPKVFRLPADMALINRMGFNNQGVQAAIINLKKRPKGLIVGGNIGKNKVTENEKAALDYRICFESLYPYVDYFTINVSSPNTPGLRDLQSISELELLVEPILQLRKGYVEKGQTHKPVFVKFAPDLSSEQLAEIIGYINKTNIEGIVLTNTTLSREGLTTSTAKIEHIGNGGLSGMPLLAKSTEILASARKLLHSDKYIIGVGGIFSGKDAMLKQKAGADLVQIYTGFIYKGPALIGRILKSFRQE